MASDGRPQNIGQLRESGYEVLTVKQEIRKNLITRIRDSQEMFPGIVVSTNRLFPSSRTPFSPGRTLFCLGSADRRSPD